MTERRQSYLQGKPGTWLDRLGVRLSARQIRKFVPNFGGKRLADLGCGYEASFARSTLAEVAGATLVDVALADDLKADPRVRAIEGSLPAALAKLPSASFDVVLLISVLEHVEASLEVLREVNRLLAPGGVTLINVPSWRGKTYLELATFRLGIGEASEVDDHKTYYDVRDLWPLLVAAGFRPRHIRCFPHKFGLNTFAVCTMPA